MITPMPPKGSVPQQQVQGGIPSSPRPPMGATQQAIKQGTGKADQKQVEILRKDPQVAQVFHLFIGKPVPMERVPEFLLNEVAGMVHKLGVNGAVALLNKTIPKEVKSQMQAEVN